MAARSYNRHGTHQEIHIGEFTRDRTGVVTGVVERHLPEDNTGSIAWDKLNKRAAPSQNGVPCVNVSRGWRDGYGIYKYSYEGFDDGFEPDDGDNTIELDISLSEDPIETHVNFAALREKYAWIASKRQFSQYLASALNKGTDALSAARKAGTADPLIGLAQANAKTAAPAQNPLYGTESYLAVGAHYRLTYARRKIPPESLALVNCIIKRPRGMELFELPSWASRRNWLSLGPRVMHRGNVMQIVEEYLLSGPRGWLTPIYNPAALKSLP